MNINNKLKQYELDFLDFEFISCKANVEQRIDPTFFELKSDGTRQNRESVVNSLCSTERDRNIDITNFIIQEIGPSTFLINYESRNQEDQEHLARTSIWREQDNDLKLLFHQATIIQPAVELE